MESIFLDEVSNKILSKSLTFIETMTNIRDSTDLLIFDTLLKITTSSRLFFFFLPPHLYYSFVQLILFVKRDSSIYLATVHR